MKAVKQKKVTSSKNKKLLASFNKHCQDHPEQRFWQALRNWSGYHFIFGSYDMPENLEDTFYKEI